MVSFITQSQRGFTLFEVVIYLALFSIFMTGVIGVVYQLLLSVDDTKQRLAIQREGNFVLQKLAAAFSGQVSVTVPDAYTCVVTKEGAETLVFRLESGQLYLKRGAGNHIAITSAAFNVHTMTVEKEDGGAFSMYFWIGSVPFHFVSYPYE